MANTFVQAMNLIATLSKRHYFGFIRGHKYIDQKTINKIQPYVVQEDQDMVLEYERKFAALIGSGQAIAYAAARMGFYDLMRVIGLKRGDEVILLGSTCSVMVNAVLRVGATPVYSEIDPNTLGSCALSIARLITARTKMIVAQHSFGVPCDIYSISEISKKNNIFLLEDCALTLGSKINNVVVGNFGDAALFSTDHSKPINTITGGFIYTKNIILSTRLRSSQQSCCELSIARKKALWARFLFERKYCDIKNYSTFKILEIVNSIMKKLHMTEGDFLSDDNGLVCVGSYPYPAKLPTFIAAIGLMEIERWQFTANERSGVLKLLMDVLLECNLNAALPKAYSNNLIEIIPLRLAWCDATNGKLKESMKFFLDISQFWFMRPIVSTKINLKMLGYRTGSCPISEYIGNNIINLPCNISVDDANVLANLIRKGMHEKNVSKKLAGN